MRDVFRYGQSKTTGETLREHYIVRQYAWGNEGLLGIYDPELDMTKTENDVEPQRESEESNLHRMAKVEEFFEMWQCSQNLRATQKESHAQIKQMTAVEYVTAQAGTVIPGDNWRKIRVVWKELCYGKAERLEDAEEAARWWRYNLVR